MNVSAPPDTDFTEAVMGNGDRGLATELAALLTVGLIALVLMILINNV